MPGLYEWFVALGPDEFQDFTKRNLSNESICRLSGAGKHMQKLFDLVHMERYVVDLDLKMRKKRSVCSKEADSIRDKKKRLKREKASVEKIEERENYALEKREAELKEKMIKLQEEGEQITQVETMIANDMIETIWDAKDNRPAVCVWD